MEYWKILLNNIKQEIINIGINVIGIKPPAAIFRYSYNTHHIQHILKYY